MKTIAIFSLALGLLGCALPDPYQQVSQDFFQHVQKAWQPFLQKETQLKRDTKLFQQKLQDLKADYRRYKQKKSNFLASLSDKELEAYSAYNQAVAANDDPGIILADRKLENLLNHSAKLEAWQKLMAHADKLASEIITLRHKAEELDDRNKRLKQEERETAEMYRGVWKDTVDMMQYQQMIGTLQGINDQLWDMNYNK